MATIDDKVFSVLTPSGAGGAALIAAVNAYTRSRMYLPYTGMPVRGLIRRLFPPIPVSIDDFVGDGPVKVLDSGDGPVKVLDSGDLFYEVAEQHLRLDDLERQVAVRTCPRWVYTQYKVCVRADRRAGPSGVSPAQRREFFFSVMGHLVSDIVALAGSR